MRLTSRGRRQVSRTLFPGSYWVFRKLVMRVPDDGVVGAPVPMSEMMRLAQPLVEWLSHQARSSPPWREFRSIDVDRIELIEPTEVRVEVAPETWWCTNCGKVYNGDIRRTGIRGGVCPTCQQRRVVQFPSFFMCPTCHRIQDVEPFRCPQCHDSRNVVLRASGGRRRQYRWTCTVHPDWTQYVFSTCRHDGSRMVLKSAGGRIFYDARFSQVTFQETHESVPVVRGNLTFRIARANVSDVIVGRRPIADVSGFWQGREHPPVQPFINRQTGRFLCLVSAITTDAIVVEGRGAPLDDVAAHSVKHALLNAAPAVTGLVQDEFGAHLEPNRGGGYSVIIYDDVAGGTGGSRMLATTRLARWVAVATELAECHQIQCDDACRGCLFLPARVCRQGNQNLDRFDVLAAIA